MTGFINNRRILDSEIIVRTASDLSGTLLSDKVYVIDGAIAMGSQQITVPQGGLTIDGIGINVSSLTSSNTSYSMFIDDGVFSGDLFLNGLSCSVTGTGSKIFDLDNNENANAVELNRVNFNQCVSLGLLDSYRQILMTNVGFVYFGATGVVDGLTIDGTMSGGMTVLTTITLGQQAGITLFQAGASLSIGGSLRSDINALSINATSVVFDFETGDFVSDSAFFLEGVRVNPAATNAITGITGSDRKAQFRNCRGFPNTHRGGVWKVSTAAATVISTINTAVKLAGTTTYSLMDHFTQSASNAIESNTTELVNIDVDGSISLTGSEGDDISIVLRHWDDSASAYIDLETYLTTFTATTGPRLPGTQDMSVDGEVVMDIGDRIEIWIENNTGTDNITASLGSRLKLSERPS